MSAVAVVIPPSLRSVADPVLASLPLSFTLGSEIAGAVTLVDGAADWPSAVTAAVAAGARAVIVASPGPVGTSRLPEAGSTVVALDTRWASNPAVPNAATALIDAVPASLRIECRIHAAVGADLRVELLDQLMLIRALLGPGTGVTMLTSSTHGYAAEAEVAGRRIALSMVCTDAVPPNAVVRMLTRDGSVELTIPGPDTAEPARLVVTDPAGRHLAPTRYESGRRATWIRVHARLNDHTTTHDLADFASDWSTVSTTLHAEG